MKISDNTHTEIKQPCPISAQQSVTKTLGPSDFANHLRANYPHLVVDELTMILKEHNSRAILNISALRNSYEIDMMRFSDKLLGSISKRCKCFAGLQSSTRFETTDTTSKGQESSTANNKHNKRGDTVVFMSLSNTSSDTSLPLGCKRKISVFGAVPYVSGPSHNVDEYFSSASRSLLSPEITESAENIAKRLELSNSVQKHSQTLCSTIKMFYKNTPIPGESTFFGKNTNILPIPCDDALSRFSLHPSAIGSIVVNPPHAEALCTKNWISRAPSDILQRTWIVHDDPPRVHVRGLHIRQCMVGSQAMEHELCCLLFRRLSQIHGSANNDASNMRWSKIVEPDFAAHVLTGDDYINIESIMKQLDSALLGYNIASCRVFFVPAFLPDGCCIYMWDMIHKSIHVLDPLAGPFGFSSARVLLHEVVTLKLHKALFKCIHKFYHTWHCSNTG